MKKNIVWLASYPKSGNTWTRIFLANYLSNAQEPMPINHMQRFGLGDSITKMYRRVAKGDFDLKDINLTMLLRDKVLRGIIANNADINLVKTHNVRSLVMGKDLIPARYTRSAIYVIRNPLDMVLSYARHYGLSNEKAVTAIGHQGNANAPDTATVWTFLSSWTDHVQTWTSKSSYPVLVLRYEDLLANPEKYFSQLLEHMGVPIDEERLGRAIGFSTFDELSKQEDKTGFAERSPNSKKFFAKGKSGQWKTDLAPELIEKVHRDHRNTMKRYGYLE